jgi:hypothetical protein
VRIHKYKKATAMLLLHSGCLFIKERKEEGDENEKMICSCPDRIIIPES